MKFLTLLTMTTAVIATPFVPTLLGEGVRSKDGSADATLILNDLQSLGWSIKSLTSAIGNYTGGRPQTAPLFTGFTNVHLANRKVFDDTLRISNFSLSVPDSRRINKFVRNRLVRDNKRAVRALEKKKKQLDMAGFREGIVGSLQALKADHESLSAVLGAKLAPSMRRNGVKSVRDISVVIQEGIDEFSID